MGGFWTGVAGVVGVGAIVTCVATAVPDLTWSVVSSRSAVVRPSGKVPYQPVVESIGSVRCSLRSADAVGLRGTLSGSDEVLGRSEASNVSELRMLCAEGFRLRHRVQHEVSGPYLYPTLLTQPLHPCSHLSR